MLSVLTDDEKALYQEQHKAAMSSSEANAYEMQQLFSNLTEMIKTDTIKNADFLLDTTQSYLERSKVNWLAREKYRAFAETKNSSLKYLIQRAAEAVDATSEGDDSSKKKGNAKGKKK